MFLTFPKLWRDAGMASPKPKETKCRDGSVQARQGIQRLQEVPSLHLILYKTFFFRLCYGTTGNRIGWKTLAMYHAKHFK